MIKKTVRIRIRKLRAKGMTYSEICHKIGREIPKGTMSYICKDVSMSPKYIIRYKTVLKKRNEVARSVALIAIAKKQKARFEQIQANASEVIAQGIEVNYEKLCLAILYFAEGSKYKSYRGLALGSADPDILRLYMSLLVRCYKKNRDDFRARIQHRSDQDSKMLIEYWRKQLDIPSSAFYLSYADKRTLNKPTINTSYKGVCVISCSGADIQLELDAIARLYSKTIWGIGAAG